MDSRITAIKPGLLLDGLGGMPKQGFSVLLKGERILWVGPQDQLSSHHEFGNAADASDNHQVLELPQATLLPGLIDCHTHTNMPGDGRTGEEVARESDDIRLLRSARNARRALESGVTTLCDCGSWNRTAFSLKDGIGLGLVDGPTVLVSGPPLTVTGGHLWFMGGEADGVDGVRRQVRYLIKQGADFIKVAASGGSTLTSYPYRPSFKVDEIKAITEEAHNRGKPVAAHCRSTASMNNAVDGDVDLILHCFFTDTEGNYVFDEPTAERLAAAEVWVNPTHYIGKTRQIELLQKQEQEELTAEERAMLDRIEAGEPKRIDQFQKLTKMGVRLIGGSDCGWGSYQFGDFQGEVMSLTDFGLSPMEAILAGTRDAAAAIGKLANIGTIEAGKQADLLLVEGNPVEDLAALRRVHTVFRGGRRVTG